MATSQTRTLANGRFVVEARLGDGGQAAVYRVRDNRLGVSRALKVLLQKYSTKTRIRNRFAAEARVMAVLEHPNIVRVYDVETEGASPYMVMELVPGGSLACWLETWGPFPPRQAAQAAIEMCAGAAAAHAGQVIHRDIKPQNVLVGADGICKITDFGIARIEEGNRTRVGAALGTQGYMAPEQSRDATRVDARADVYSIGVTLYVLLCCSDPIDWLSGRGRDAVPEPLRKVMERATHPRVNQRIGSAEELAAELEWALQQLPPDPFRIPLGQELPPRPRESSGGVLDDFADLAGLLDGLPSQDTKTTFVEPIRPTYTMPKPIPLEALNTPEWVDREARPVASRGYVIGLAEVSNAPPAARARRTEMSRSIESRASAVDLHLASTQDAGTSGPIWRWALVGLLLALLSVGTAVGKLGWDTARASEARASSLARLDQAIGEEHGLVDALAGLGADRADLEVRYQTWQRAGGPARGVAALQWVDLVDRTSEALAQPGAADWESAHRHVRRLRVARDAYQRETAPPASAMGIR